MMEVKICGLTNYEDAALAADLDVDALGFIFYSKSPRYVMPESVKAIIERLMPVRPVIVGVFVNETADDVKAIMDLCHLDMIQLHGDESVQYCRQFPAARLIKALTPEMGSDIESLGSFPAKAILVDARDADRYGGTGMQSDWSIARKISKLRPLVLAGGLNERNILEAADAVSPQAVDINSGIESSPGMKDGDKLRNILAIIRSIERSTGINTAKIFSRK